MIADFAAVPVSTREIGKGFCTALLRIRRTDVEGKLGHFFGIGGSCAVDGCQAARPGQVCLQGLEGINVYRALVEASVCNVGLFGVGKKGVPSSAVRRAL